MSLDGIPRLNSFFSNKYFSSDNSIFKSFKNSLILDCYIIAIAKVFFILGSSNIM